MKSGKYTAQSLARKYLERIDDVDKRGPAINSVIEPNPDAPAIAENLDRERKAGRVRGPLHGIPVLIKDNIDTHDRMTTTAGSLALEGSTPPQDSTVAGNCAMQAVIVGKTNLSEWANFRSSHSSAAGAAGRARRRILTCWIVIHAARARGRARPSPPTLRPLGIGTETDGSVVCPSNANSLVGIKPTLGD